MKRNLRRDLKRWLEEAKAVLVNPHTGEVKIRITNDRQLVLSRKQALECHDLLKQYEYKTYNEILYALGACHGLAGVELRDVVHITTTTEFFSVVAADGKCINVPSAGTFIWE